MTTAELLERASKQKRRLTAATTAEKNEALEKMESIKDDFPESAEVVGHFIEFIAASDRGLAR